MYRVAVRKKTGETGLFDVTDSLDIDTTRAAVLEGVPDAAAILILVPRPVQVMQPVAA